MTIQLVSYFEVWVMPPHAAPDKEKVGMRQREYRSKIRVTKFFTCVKL